MSYSLETIAPYNSLFNKKMDTLLKNEGIKRDGHLDYSCGLFDDDYNIVATGSCYNNTLRCLAVSSSHRGEGLMNEVVSHLMNRLFEQGYTHIFLYTKISNINIFKDLGFYEIARVEPTLVFMENRRNGFESFLSSLEKPEGSFSSVCGIVMNANPFTLGHRYLVEKASSENDLVHLFVLSEEAGPIPFSVRKKLVEEGTKDLKNVIIHESGPYMISSATFPSYFLKDEDSAIMTHGVLDIAIFSSIAGYLGIKTRYAGSEKTSHVTSLYNQIMAEKLPEAGIKFVEVQRLEKDGSTVSASTVRQAIHDDRFDEVLNMLPESTARYFSSPESETVRNNIKNMKDPRHY
ncbi:MAG: [citrate (pro-3S)-lyase] ligase [Sphaerochaetaceae bacterium]|nr:[citrate (pro-3S)-lyase] ligase [Sphaerochaetaceae bacterium]